MNTTYDLYCLYISGRYMVFANVDGKVSDGYTDTHALCEQDQPFARLTVKRSGSTIETVSWFCELDYYRKTGYGFFNDIVCIELDHCDSPIKQVLRYFNRYPMMEHRVTTKVAEHEYCISVFLEGVTGYSGNWCYDGAFWLDYEMVALEGDLRAICPYAGNTLIITKNHRSSGPPIYYGSHISSDVTWGYGSLSVLITVMRTRYATLLGGHDE